MDERDFGYAVYGTITYYTAIVDNEVYMNTVEYTCPYDNKEKQLRVGCVVTPKPGMAFYGGKRVAFGDLPSIGLHVYNAGQDVQLITTEIDALCYTFSLTLDAIPTLHVENTYDNLWSAEYVQIFGDGRIELAINNAKTDAKALIHGRKRYKLCNSYNHEDARFLLGSLQNLIIDFSKFENGKLDLEVEEEHHASEIRLYMDRDTFMQDAAFTRQL